MTIRITKKPNLKSILPQQRDIVHQLELIGKNQIRDMIARTLAGFAITGRRFKEYSAAYKQYKQDKGRSGNPDLYFTGRMLGSMASVVNQVGLNTILKIFPRADEGNKIIWNEENGRRFFGFSKTEQTAIRKQLNSFIIQFTKRR